MLLQLLRGGDFQQAMIWLLLAIPCLLFSLSFHEAAHAFAANKMGDPTAKNLGRLTMNPMKHLDPVGFGAMLLLGIGWAKPVPVFARRFKNPRNGMMITSLAGPLSNVLLALIGAIGFVVMNLIMFDSWIGFGSFFHEINNQQALDLFGITNIQVIIHGIFFIFTWMNATLAVFNMMPVPPLDGSRLAFVLLPDKYYFGMMKYERYIMIGFILLMAIGWLSPLIGWLSNGLISLLIYLPRLIAGI